MANQEELRKDASFVVNFLHSGKGLIGVVNRWPMTCIIRLSYHREKKFLFDYCLTSFIDAAKVADRSSKSQKHFLEPININTKELERHDSQTKTHHLVPCHELFFSVPH